MRYYVDSSAIDWSGHNLEYLRRLANEHSSPSKLLTNRRSGAVRFDLAEVVPTFRFRTLERGRYWTGGASRSRVESPIEEVHVPDRSRSTIDRRLAMADERISRGIYRTRFRSKRVFERVSSTDQAKAFAEDLAQAIDPNETAELFVSSANEREIAGLVDFLAARRAERRHTQAVVMLRGPLVQCLSKTDLGLETVFGFLRACVLREAARYVHFVADTPELVDLYERLLGIKVTRVHPPSLEMSTSPGVTMDALSLAPGRRMDTLRGLSDPCVTERVRSRLLALQPQVGLDSNEYRTWIASAKSMLFPYDPYLYRHRSSGVLVEALCSGVLPIVPTGTTLSRFVTACWRSSGPERANAALQEWEFGTQCRRDLDPATFPRQVFIHLMHARSAVIQIRTERLGVVNWSRHDLSIHSSEDSFFVPAGVGLSIEMHADSPERNHTLRVRVNELCSRTGSGLTVPGICFLPMDLAAALELAGESSLSSRYRSWVSDLCDTQGTARIVDGILGGT